MLSVIMLSVIMLSVIILSVIMLSIIMLSVIMLSVVLPNFTFAKFLPIGTLNCLPTCDLPISPPLSAQLEPQKWYDGHTIFLNSAY